MDHSDQSLGFPVVPTNRQTTLSPLDLQRQKVMLGLPFYKTTNPITTFCLMQLLDKRRMSTVLNYGDAYVIHSRDACVSAFLESDMDWLLMLDDDLVISCGNAKLFNQYTDFNLPEKFSGLHAVDRLLSHGKTLIGALYFGRNKHGLPMYCEGACNPTEAAYARKAPYDLIKQTRWVATGCLLIHRNVFLDIEKRFPRLGRQKGEQRVNFFSPSEDKIMEVVDRTREMLSNGPMDGEKALRAFEMLEQGAAEARRENSLGQGEDVCFCRRAAASGHVAYVDMGLILGHISSGTVYGPTNTFPKPR